MTQEDKQLLLIDLCARLPYGVKVQHNNKKEVFGVVEQIEVEGDIDLSYYDEEAEKWKLCCTSIDNVKPYLRSMSNMTEKENEIWHSKMRREIKEAYPYAAVDTSYIEYFQTSESFDYLNSIHVDYRCLISKGLALEAPEEMYES